MEHTLTINLLPWREKKAYRKKITQRGMAFFIIVLTSFTLCFIYQKEEVAEKTMTTIRTINPLEQKAFKAKQQWIFLTQFFDVISNQLPSGMIITELSQEDGKIALNATTQNLKTFSVFFKTLSQQLKSSTIKIMRLSEKGNAMFAISITPNFKPGKLTIKATPFDLSKWTSIMLQRARDARLLIELNPTETGIHLTLQGEYSNLMNFLFQLKQSRWPILLTHWQIKPNNKNIVLEIDYEVIH